MTLFLRQHFLIVHLICRKPVITLAKRFFPNVSKVIPSYCITPSSARRLMQLFSRGPLYYDAQRILPDTPSMIQAITALHQLNPNRKSFFLSIRRMVETNTLDLPREALFMPINDKINTISSFFRAHYFPKEGVLIKEKQSEKVKNSNEKISLEEKLIACEQERTNILSLMKKLQAQYEDNGFIDKAIIKEWTDYVNTRKPLLPLNLEEKNVYDFLVTLVDKNTPSKEEFLKQKENEREINMIQLQYDTTINVNLFNNILDKCIMLSDYENAIKDSKQAIAYLKGEGFLTTNDIIFLARCSNAVKMDRPNKPQFKAEAYPIIEQNAKILGIPSTNIKVPSHLILEKIKEKKFFLLKEPDNPYHRNEVPGFWRLHKVLIIPMEYQGNSYVIGATMCTSAKKNNEKVSDFQETNLDDEKRNRGEYFHCFISFLSYNDLSFTLDLLMQGFYVNKNILDEDVVDIVYKKLESCEEIWSNNFLLEPFDIDRDMLCKIALMFHEQNLTKLEAAYSVLKEKLDAMPKKEREDECKKKEQEKLTALAQKENDKYLSSLAAEFQLLLPALKKFKEIMILDKKKQDKQDKKSPFKLAKQKEIETSSYEIKKEEKPETPKITNG